MTNPRVPSAVPGPTPDGASGQASKSARRSRPSVRARRPEIVPIASTALAWVALAAISPMSSWSTAGDGSLAGGTTDRLLGTHAGHGGVFTPAGIAMVALMTVAMMAPLAVPGVRTVAFSSARWRAGRASLWFFVAYLATWVVLSVCLAPIAEMLAGVLGSPTLAAGILAVACALAEFDPRRANLTRACDRPIALRSGPDANVDSARFGLLTAGRGLRLCVLPMLTMLAVPSSLLVMALVTALSVTDRVTQGYRRLLIAVSYLILAGVLLMTV